MFKKALFLFFVFGMLLYASSCGGTDRPRLPVGGETDAETDPPAETFAPYDTTPCFSPEEPFTVSPGILVTEEEPFRTSYGVGHCRKLKGNPLVVLFFMDDDESSWSAEEVTAYTDNYVTEGLRYLEDKAAEWGVDLHFSVESYSTPLTDYATHYAGTVIRDLRISGSTKDILDHAAQALGLSDDWELYSKFQAAHGEENDVIFLALLNKAGKSYTRNILSAGNCTYAEHCVIFSDYLEGPSFGCKASTVAHELLHLFGAEDFYLGARESLAWEKYPKDIMLWMPKEAYENEIGDFTAYAVGWTDTVPEICYNEIWWE